MDNFEDAAHSIGPKRLFKRTTAIRGATDEFVIYTKGELPLDNNGTFC